MLSREQVSGRLPSVMAGVVRDGRLVWWAAHGTVTGAGAAGPAAGSSRSTTTTQYRIGSITKTITAVLVMQLRDAGELDLADSAAEHLPELTGTYHGDRSLRSLLSHSSGIASEPAGPWWERSPGGSFSDLVRKLPDVPPAHAPGSTYHYSNVAYALLGEVVARRRGQPWLAQVEERVLQPLGMTRTTYLPQAPATTGYSVHHFAGTVHEEPAYDAAAMAPAGQLWSTVEDLGAYADFLISGHRDVLDRSSLEEMATPQSGSLAGAAQGGYGLGLRLVPGGSGSLWGHSGSMPGFLAGIFVDPTRRTGAVVLANATTGLRCEGLPVDLLRVLEEVEPSVLDAWQPTSLVPAAVAEVLGVWHWGNTALGFSYDGRDLLVGPLRTGETTERFRPEKDGSFLGLRGYHHGERMRVVRNHDGAINHLVCATFVYTRAPYDPSAPVPGR
jgi:CubicO group peptidase (beta-lactamase class C family)